VPSEQTSQYWDAQAPAFGDEPDHGLRDPVVRDAWRHLLRASLPEPPADIADLGCGTGSLSVLLAVDGYRVQGVDISGEMVAAAARKSAAADVAATFHTGDASEPDIADASIDAVVVRHVTWALTAPGAAIRRWASLLRDDGRLVLVEGQWSTGAGLTAEQLAEIVRPVMPRYEIRALTDPALWGGPIRDERYVLVARR